MCTAESTTCTIATEAPIYINTIKIVTHIIDDETVTCISAAETSNWTIATETVTTYITATDVITCIIAIESVSYIVLTETVTCRFDYIQKTFTCKNGASQRFF